MPDKRPQVVIVGAGFGGIEAAKSLSRAPVDVTLIDRQNYHCFQPLLYQVATAALSPADVAWPIRHILRRQQNVTVFMAEVAGIDLAARRVQIAGDPIGYDYLVLATGATHSYFGHDEWADCAPGLKRIEDATRIRRSLLIAFEHAELTGDEAERQRLLTFVIVGGGATGVEMAGAIAEIALQTLPQDFRRIDPRQSKIVLLEAGPRVLPTFPEELSDYATRALTRMGVDVRTSTRVDGCDGRGVNLDQGRLDAGTVIWAAGVIASPAAAWLNAAHDRAGRVIVGPELALPEHPNVFVIGDTASVRDEKGNMVPGVAPAAKQMGRYVGKLIAAHVAGNFLPAFRYAHPGDLATIGRRAAVVNLDRLRLKGFVGWLFWSVAHIYFLIGLRHRFMVAFTWLWDDLTRQRGARLITEIRPQDRRDAACPPEGPRHRGP
jgi:NADH dehydrogenase